MRARPRRFGLPSPVRGLGGIRDLRGFYGRTVYVAIWGLGSGLRVKTGVGTSDLESCALVPKPDLTFDSIARVGKSEPRGHEVDNKRGGRSHRRRPPAVQGSQTVAIRQYDAHAKKEPHSVKLPPRRTRGEARSCASLQIAAAAQRETNILERLGGLGMSLRAPRTFLGAGCGIRDRV